MSSFGDVDITEDSFVDDLRRQLGSMILGPIIRHGDPVRVFG
jgi:hypothetical protein